MKKKNMKNHIKMRFSTLLLCCLAIVLYAAPRGWADVYDEGGEHDVREDIIGSCLVITNSTTVNLYASVEQYVIVGPYSVLNIYSGGSVEQSVYVGPYSVLNIYSGSVGWHISINEYADAWVYGTGFEDKLGPVDYGQWTPDDGEETLTGQYKDTSQINLLFQSDTPINLQPPTSGGSEEITIDIKPGSADNKINPKSRGVVPVAVLTTGEFDAIDVDPTSVVLAGATPERWTLCDVDGDGDEDMLFHFRTQELNLDENITKATEATETTLTLTGNKKTDLKVIKGTDKVCIVSGKK